MELNNEEIIQTSFCDVNSNNASSDLWEYAILTNFGAKIFAGNMAPNMEIGWGGTRRVDTSEIGILAVGEETVPNLDVGCGDGSCGEGGTPMEHTYQQKNVCIYAPLWLRGVHKFTSMVYNNNFSPI